MRRLSLLVLATLSVVGIANAGDWPMVNGCRERISHAADEASLRVPFDTVEDYQVPGRDVSCVEGVLYVGVSSDSNVVIAHDTETDVELWRFGIPGSGGSVNCVPAVGESLVYCGGQSGFGLYALDRTTGHVRWSKPLGSLYTRNPILDGERVYIIQDSTYCLDAATGTTIWSYPFADQGTPAVDDSSLYVPSGQGAMALDKFTGDVRWITPAGSRVIQALAVNPPFLYVYSGGAINAVHTSNGQLAWSITPQGVIAWFGQGTIAVTDSAVFYVTWGDSVGAGAIYCHDRFTGALRWNHVFASEGAFVPTIANGVVYAATWNPERALWGFDIHSGAIAFRDTTASYWYQPIVAGHRLFAPYSGGIRAFGNSVGVDDGAHAPRLMTLRCYPNPCRDLAWVSLALPGPRMVGLTVYDLQGRAVASLAPYALDTGAHVIPLEIGDLSAGSYVYRVDAGAQTASGRLLVMR